jgi:hypothetical protein
MHFARGLPAAFGGEDLRGKSMGYAVTWCAVREEAADQLLSHFGLSSTGETEEDPESRFSTAKLTTGWRLIWSNKYACPILAKSLPTFSGGHEVVLCQIEEHVMASSAELWISGNRRWLVSHEGENGPKGLEAEGDLPQCFTSIRKEMEEAQSAEGGDDADVDYIFEIPLKLAQALVGFKHDENHASAVKGSFAVLSGGKSGKGLFSRLFGK